MCTGFISSGTYYPCAYTLVTLKGCTNRCWWNKQCTNHVQCALVLCDRGSLTYFARPKTRSDIKKFSDPKISSGSSRKAGPWSRFLLIILLFFLPLFLGGKRKGEKNIQSRGFKSYDFLLALFSVYIFYTNSLIFHNSYFFLGAFIFKNAFFYLYWENQTLSRNIICTIFSLFWWL